MYSNKNFFIKLFLVILFVTPQLNLWAKSVCPINTTTTSDSLLNILKTEKNEAKKIALYRDLADLNICTEAEPKYLNNIYEIAATQPDKEIAIQTLYDLVIYYVDKDSIEVAENYKKEIAKYITGERLEQVDTYLSMLVFNRSILKSDSDEAIQQKIDTYNKETSSNNLSIYKKIEQAHMVATAIYTSRNTSIPYAEEAVRLANTLPLKDGIDYVILTKRLLARLYAFNKMPSESIKIIQQVIEAKENFKKKYCAHRKFYPMTSFYISNYSTMMINVNSMPKEQATKYMHKILDLASQSNNLADKYNCFLAINNYHVSQKDEKGNILHENIKGAIIAIDTLIKYAETIAPYNLVGLYNLSARMYSMYGDHEQAYKTLKTSFHLKDSLENLEFDKKLNILQVEYDVNKLNYEKSQLEIHNKLVTIIALIIVLLLATGICIYLYMNLKKERLTMIRLAELNEKAEQSEKMKSAFINSICHEIRTPLNAIAGFSELITDPSFEEDKETQLQFSNQIRTNTEILTGLIDVIIEVANLDVSDEMLEREQTEIAVICRNSLARYSTQKSNIEYHVDINPTSITIPTHARYFGLVIENLLNNANKFTESGSISLKCQITDANVIISITDTGCGIPEDMQEHVFMRFAKLDSFAQGSGLGLYLCRLIIKRLAGKIYIDPTYKNGTRVIIELPTK